MLEIKNMTVSYREKAVLENLSATFEKGRLVSIVGVNGAGKSTLLKSLLGLVNVTDGGAYLDGESVFSPAEQ